MHPALDNLCGPGKSLKPEAPDANELAGLLRTGIARLHDARNTTLALESRFDLAYNAAHALWDVDERLVNDLIAATAAVAKAVQP